MIVEWWVFLLLLLILVAILILLRLMGRRPSRPVQVFDFVVDESCFIRDPGSTAGASGELYTNLAFAVTLNFEAESQGQCGVDFAVADAGAGGQVVLRVLSLGPGESRAALIPLGKGQVLGYFCEGIAPPGDDDDGDEGSDGEDEDDFGGVLLPTDLNPRCKFRATGTLI